MRPSFFNFYLAATSVVAWVIACLCGLFWLIHHFGLEIPALVLVGVGLWTAGLRAYWESKVRDRRWK